MSRFLFVVPPFYGHINPTLAVGAELTKRGHAAGWVGYNEILAKVLPKGATILPITPPNERVFSQAASRITAKDSQCADISLGLSGFKFLMESVLVPLTENMIDGVKEAVENFKPDIVIVDQQCFAGAIVSVLSGLPWVTFCTTSASVTFEFSEMPKVNEWLIGLLEDLQTKAGIVPEKFCDLSPFPTSSKLVIVFSTREFCGPSSAFPDHYRFVGPAIRGRVEDTPFPWEELSKDLPKILVSLGTLNANRGSRFYQSVVTALADLELQVILVAPTEMLPDTLPKNFIARSFVPQLALLKHVDAVISHGGHNTVVETLANGLPLIIAPITDDQPVIAGQVEEAGAGIRISFRRSGPKAIKSAVEKILKDTCYRNNAKKIKHSFINSGGTKMVADLLESNFTNCGPNIA